MESIPERDWVTVTPAPQNLSQAFWSPDGGLVYYVINAADYKGDLSLALADLVHAREGLEDFAGRSEAAHENTLRSMRDRSEADFREGRTVTWEDLKARNAARSIELLKQYPRMYPVRRRGLMRGYRYFATGKHLVYYSVSSQEVRITAIIPGAMRRA